MAFECSSVALPAVTASRAWNADGNHGSPRRSSAVPVRRSPVIVRLTARTPGVIRASLPICSGSRAEHALPAVGGVRREERAA